MAANLVRSAAMAALVVASLGASSANAGGWGGAAAGLEGYMEGQRDAQRQQRGEAPSNMEYARRDGESQDAGGGYTRCPYSTLRGFTFSINVRGYSCPFSVQVNPTTMQVLLQ